MEDEKILNLTNETGIVFQSKKVQAILATEDKADYFKNLSYLIQKIPLEPKLFEYVKQKAEMLSISDYELSQKLYRICTRKNIHEFCMFDFFVHNLALHPFLVLGARSYDLIQNGDVPGCHYDMDQAIFLSKFKLPDLNQNYKIAYTLNVLAARLSKHSIVDEHIPDTWRPFLLKYLDKNNEKLSILLSFYHPTEKEIETKITRAVFNKKYKDTTYYRPLTSSQEKEIVNPQIIYFLINHHHQYPKSFSLIVDYFKYSEDTSWINHLDKPTADNLSKLFKNAFIQQPNAIYEASHLFNNPKIIGEPFLEKIEKILSIEIFKNYISDQSNNINPFKESFFTLLRCYLDDFHNPEMRQKGNITEYHQFFDDITSIYKSFAKFFIKQGIINETREALIGLWLSQKNLPWELQHKFNNDKIWKENIIEQEILNHDASFKPIKQALACPKL